MADAAINYGIKKNTYVQTYICMEVRTDLFLKHILEAYKPFKSLLKTESFWLRASIETQIHWVTLIWRSKTNLRNAQ